jgi:hypothetical protein
VIGCGRYPPAQQPEEAARRGADSMSPPEMDISFLFLGGVINSALPQAASQHLPATSIGWNRLYRHTYSFAANYSTNFAEPASPPAMRFRSSEQLMERAFFALPTVTNGTKSAFRTPSAMLLKENVVEPLTE